MLIKSKHFYLKKPCKIHKGFHMLLMGCEIATFLKRVKFEIFSKQIIVLWKGLIHKTLQQSIFYNIRALKYLFNI